MGGDGRVRNSEQEAESAAGLLFRLSARAGAVLFAGVLAVALARGMEPTLALVRALTALVALTSCGWVAERIAGAARREAKRPAEPAESGEPRTDDGQDMAAQPAPQAQ
ncbi:MAG: hypothetical protein U0531_15755 [Dehalococcoidia bacterium]